MTFFPSAAFAAPTALPGDPPVKGDLTMKVAPDGTLTFTSDQPCMASKRQPGFVGVVYMMDATGAAIGVDEPAVNGKGLWTSTLSVPDTIGPNDQIDVFAFCFPNANDPVLFQYNPIGVGFQPDTPTGTTTDPTTDSPTSASTTDASTTDASTSAAPTSAAPTSAAPTDAPTTDVPSHSADPTKAPTKAPRTPKKHHKFKIVPVKHKSAKNWHPSTSSGSKGGSGKGGSKAPAAPVSVPAAPVAPVATPVTQNPTFTG
jgi:hypothetical protein